MNATVKNPDIKAIVRWLGVVGLGGFAAWMTVSVLYGIWSRFDGEWLAPLFVLTAFATCIFPLYATAYICYRRRYRQLYRVVGLVAAMIVFDVSMLLSRQLQQWWDERYLRPELNDPLHITPWVHVVGLPLALACLLVPFWAAARTYRLFERFTKEPAEGAPTAAPEHGSVGIARPESIETENRSPIV